jgi:nicotinate-nucleotide adenylyltransferase
MGLEELTTTKFIGFGNGEIRTKGVSVRLGLFGGTFDPIHYGHLRAALEVKEAFELEKVLLIPSAFPPHKEIDRIADAQVRFQMLQLAVKDVPFLEASDVELKRTGPSYTIDTLKNFRNRFGRSVSLFFIVGVDAFGEVNTWKSYKDLFSLAEFVVMTRPGARLKNLRHYIREYISEAYEKEQRSPRFRHPAWRTIHQLPITRLDISATVIRKKRKAGQSIRFLVPPEVDAYIEEKKLYR